MANEMNQTCIHLRQQSGHDWLSDIILSVGLSVGGDGGADVIC